MVWRTTAITISTCFLLGTTFTHWIADHNVLWRSPLTTEALAQSITYYSLMGAAPSGLGWIYIFIGVLALGSTGGRMVKGWRGTSGEVLFDGGSLVLLAAIAYNQINEVYPTITLFPAPLPDRLQDHPLYPGLATAVRDLANDNVITAVMLTGVMFLQAGRYYAKRPASSPPPSTVTSAHSSPPTSTIPLEERRTSTQNRSGTPFRELTEEEAMELRGLNDSNTGGGRTSHRVKSRKR